jgi:hypothetical protein
MVSIAIAINRCAPDWGRTYRAAGGIVVGALASDLEGNIVGGVALDLDGAGREVVEVLVQELEAQRQSSSHLGARAFVVRGELSRNAASPRTSFPTELGIARTSLAALAISEKAGTDILAVV